MYIAVDFDGTLVENAFPAVGKEVPLAVETVKYLISKGNKIILHTCRTHDNHDGHDCLAEAEQWCRDRGIELYAVNDNPENRKYWGAQEPVDKVYADVYIDDHSFGMPLTDNHVEWSDILRHFKSLYGDLTNKEEITISMKPFVEVPCRDFLIEEHIRSVSSMKLFDPETMDGCFCVSDGKTDAFVDTIEEAEKRFLDIIMCEERKGDASVSIAYRKKDTGECNVFDCDFAFYWLAEDDHIFCADKVREEKEANKAKEKAQTKAQGNANLTDDYVTALCDDLTKPKIVEISCEKEKANNAGAVSD